MASLEFGEILSYPYIVAYGKSITISSRGKCQVINQQYHYLWSKELQSFIKMKS